MFQENTMTQDDLARVRDDLETIKSAIGLPPRWDPREVRINLLLAAAGLAAMVWALVPHELSPLLGLCFFAVPVIEWLRTAEEQAKATWPAESFAAHYAPSGLHCRLSLSLPGAARSA